MFKFFHFLFETANFGNFLGVMNRNDSLFLSSLHSLEKHRICITCIVICTLHRSEEQSLEVKTAQRHEISTYQSKEKREYQYS